MNRATTSAWLADKLWTRWQTAPARPPEVWHVSAAALGWVHGIFLCQATVARRQASGGEPHLAKRSTLSAKLLRPAGTNSCRLQTM